MCHNHEREGCGSADVDTWQLSNSLDPIKPRAVRVIYPNNSLIILLLSTPILTMSLVNSCVFECSMGHRISREDARFHLHTSDGQHYPSNQQVRSCPDLGLTNLTAGLVVGRPCDDA